MLLPTSRLESRALGSDSQGGPNFSSSTWIPIAVVVSVLTLLAILACTRKSIRSRVAAMGSGVAIASGMPPRELTAEQLAGSINRAPAAPPRRTRRPRRTPSQISTVSLPAYMKEPGEQELVVSRGPDGEDVAMPAASAVEEDDDQSHEDHQSSEEGNANPNPPDNSRYSPMPHSPHDTPLLGGDDPRGEAPAYFEVLEPGEANYPPGISVAPPEPESPMPQRRSGFFSMFRSAPPAVPLPAASPANDTVPAVDSTSRLSLTHTRTRSTTNTPNNTTRHRASTSTSTLFSLGRKKSSASLAHGNLNNLTSPSLISLASISHPLPHTLVKTEFSALPKNGFTPEQLSLISGTKEGGVSRFGVPWGDAAVAYAHASASTSRIALPGEGDAPPPGWDEIPGLPVPSGSGLPSSSSEQAVASSSPAEASGSGSGVATARLSTSSAASPSAAETLTPATALSRADFISRPPATPAESLAPTSLSRADSHASHASRTSRASGVSTQTFATAREEGGSDTDTEEEDEEDVSALRLNMHTLEGTDATVRP
ncbi:Proteophosphoglycan ppg4 [Favolaschia claudopus]|uniref:Proteophosphoglycan ppg4 n=1 Tax=Favolaschia claudopus TaxID=2862362 RepID=A0AAW0B594_9AGAR